MIGWNWLFSKTVRQAVELRKHALKLVSAQRDLLRPEAIRAIEQAAEQLDRGVQAKEDKAELLKRMQHLETVANEWLKPYPHAGMRENLEVILVAVAVAMGIRTFFLQPFKIPTGSMQPTLNGIKIKDLRDRPNARIPAWPRRWFDSWFLGESFYHEVAHEDGTFEILDPRPVRVFPLVTRQRFQIGNGDPHSIWFPPDHLFEKLGLRDGTFFHKGEDVIKMRMTAGDHLFVDRFTYNFRRPRRGEIVVFETRGIEGLPQDQYYIKRLVALGGENVRIKNDRHVVINGHELTAATPHFQFVYSFKGPPEEDHYSGHVNGYIAMLNRRPGLAPLFPDQNTVFHVPPKHYLVLGDNTMDSLDSRTWGAFYQTNVIGTSFFVYWPFADHFGWAVR